MNVSFRLIAKIGLLLVVIGFFMPVACDGNGFKIADFLVKNDKALEGILMYILFISALAGVVLGALSLTGKSFGASIDWSIIIVCIVSGLIPYFSLFKDVKLQNGAYVILAGWIIALVAQILSTMKRES